jgi:4-oxalocrotonate tautomerase
MPFVSVKLLKGRTQEQKRELATAITDAMEKICGAPRSGTMVTFEEYDKGDWAIAGQLVSDRDG